ncbi:MAG: hypothetical protein IPM92_17230, partial [Saprospiraceae bacterium]|nr:hypothetical protein [Saprospiraceae bacterium]
MGSLKNKSRYPEMDGRQALKNLAVNSGIGQFALSPNGKEIAFVNRGEVFVTSVE